MAHYEAQMHAYMQTVHTQGELFPPPVYRTADLVEFFERKTPAGRKTGRNHAPPTTPNHAKSFYDDESDHEEEQNDKALSSSDHPCGQIRGEGTNMVSGAGVGTFIRQDILQSSAAAVNGDLRGRGGFDADDASRQCTRAVL